ncbi:MAG: class I SAM-dependent methyltransferase [Betaproteobacteria bacterium]|nr:class I SAM-dependent methyltransferase [Betaproteobacteria bacterium]
MGLIRKAKNALKRTFPFPAAVRELYYRSNAGQSPIYLDYSVNVQPRYGWGKPPHQRLHYLIAKHKDSYLRIIERLRPYEAKLAAIPVDAPADPSAPFWMNRFVMGLDAAALYAFPALFNSRLYVEVGSGNSTKFARRSIIDNNLETRIVSVDPEPRAEIDALCHEVVRRPVETVDPEIFDRLQPGDILMIDNSHRCFQNSDVTITFLEILPRLKPGVLIYIDDIYLPHDYPADWAQRYYSEQYLLAATLLADKGERYEVVFPGFFVSGIDTDLMQAAADFWQRCGFPQFATTRANGFWMRVVS